MKSIILIFIFFLLIMPFQTKSQNINTESKFQVLIQVLNSSGAPLEYVHIINLNNSTGTISDTNGFLSLWISKNDYLKFSNIGYFDKMMYCSEFKEFTINRVYLNQRVYELKTYNVNPSWTKDEFVKKFSSHEFEDDDVAKIQKKMLTPLNTPEELRSIYNAANNGKITIPLNYTSKRQAQINKRELFKLYKNAFEDNVFRIAKLTNFKEDDLSDFIAYCNFTKEYLYYTPEYEICMKIKELYDDYLKMKKENK